MCFNSAATIGQTISSVANQSHLDIEHIVVDGQSNDSTMQIVLSSPSVSKHVSEPDSGIYDAMNKGIKLCTGDVIGILNADDFYADNQVLQKIVAVFQDASIDACYGDLLYVDQFNTEKIIRYWRSSSYSPGKFKNGWMPAHPTFFVRRRFYEEFGQFDLSYKLAADFELLFRFIEIHRVRTKYLPDILVRMRMGGATNKSIGNIVNQNKEILRALKQYYGTASVSQFIASKFFNKLSQFWSRPRTKYIQ